MELRVLRYFVTVARIESITHAADLLHITQPTLSRQLTNLEEELGMQLLIRGKRKISLTDGGKLLLQRAEEILAIADKTEKEFREHQNLEGGEISIGSVEAITSEVLSKLLRSFNAEYPQVRYTIFSGTEDVIKEKIDNGILDVGFILEPANIEGYNFTRLPQESRWGILTNLSSSLAQKENIKPKDLIGIPLIIPIRPLVQNELASWFADDYDQLHILATYNLIFNGVFLVENELGAAICLEGAVASMNFNSVCFKPFYPEFKSGSLILWKKHKIFSPTTARFLQFIKHAFQA
ncbi:LysR family transcriptional regulator [Neobacillus sp. YX16]|uniref:LysR family transcriptional regulator n=1 Tax=Neobacillus sp. YX16 TaxID=3047874 RepID=UPI0024C2948A|nr:LysR family transcriptional regulator [Neobacillus sp. YX16]WHZ00891.1 LysR family transcriptional regulator [Neobacillus sp. YX16]